MNYDKEIANLAGETLALQTLLTALLAGLSKSGNEGQALVSRSFDVAANFVENRVVEAGRRVPPEHLGHALRVVEELRTATLGAPEKP